VPVARRQLVHLLCIGEVVFRLLAVVSRSRS
jgi:hypothetical protein